MLRSLAVAEPDCEEAAPEIEWSSLGVGVCSGLEFEWLNMQNAKGPLKTIVYLSHMGFYWEAPFAKKVVKKFMW